MMKKNFTYYGIVWLIALLVFNVIVFVAPTVKVGSFWIGYVFIMLSFIAQLACSYIYFKQENISKRFLNLPIISLSYSGLIVSLLVGAICMAVPTIPYWIAIIVCVFISAVYAIAIVKSKAAADMVENIDNKIKTKTFFIKALTVDAQTLMSRAQSDEARELTKKVYEAIRYSDPMSNDALAGAESSITIKFKEFEEAIINNDADLAIESSKELLILINDRNQKCKLLK